MGLGALTLYAFSTENWKRPRYEVDALMRMLRKYLRIELAEINRQNIRFQTIGRTEALAPRVKDEIARASQQTAANTGMVLSVALNYGGRAEIVDACRTAMKKLAAQGKSADELDEESIERDRPWIVIVWNDPINLMTYVTYVFQKLFGFTKEKAEHDVARLQEHGLWATMRQD